MCRKIYSEKMKECLEKNSHVFVGYITAGYPDEDTFMEVTKETCKRGLSILEVGFPSENPYVDGEVIKQAHKIVGTDLCHDMDFWRRLRQEVDVPIWLMGYCGDLVDSGIYMEMAKEHLYDALVIPDTDNNTRIRLKNELKDMGIDVIGLISNTDRFSDIQSTMKEFALIYQKLYSGPTGTANDSEDYLELLDYGKMYHKNIMFGGFGVSSAERVKELLTNGFFGTIIGTELMRKLNNSPKSLYEFVEELSVVLREEIG